MQDITAFKYLYLKYEKQIRIKSEIENKYLTIRAGIKTQ